MTEVTEKNILVIDDLSSMRAIIKKQIAKKCLGNVTEAWDIKSACEALTSQSISLIISDVHLKQENVSELIDWLDGRKSEKQIPMIVMTSDMHREGFEAIAKRNIVSYLLKPFSSDELERQVKKIFEEHL